MSVYVFSSTMSIEAGQQRIQRLLMPLLEKIYGKYDSKAQKDIVIDDNNNLLINGTPIGDWRLMYCFETDGVFLSFKYGGEKNYKNRMVMFGTDPFDVSACHEVYGVYEYTPKSSTPKIIYECERVKSF